MLRAPFIVFLILLMVFAGACSFGGNEPDRSNPPENQIPTQENPSAGDSGDNYPENMAIDLPPIDQVDEVAAVLYQAVLEEVNVVGLVEEIYEALGIPVLDPETELDQIENAVNNQTPFALESQMELIANALASGMHINLESFIAEINRLGESVMSDPIEVVFGGVYETSDGPIPVSDRRQVWLEISETEVTMNFEPLGATVTIDGQTVPFPGAFVFRSIPANLMTNNSCDGE